VIVGGSGMTIGEASKGVVGGIAYPAEKYGTGDL
jgi:hypothetical protein